MKELASIQPLQTAFVKKLASVDWREAVWGLEHGWLGWRSLVELAQSGDPASDAASELARCGKDQSHEAVELARTLASREGPPDIESIRKKWLYLSLAWLYSRRQDIPEVWKLVELLYAEFEYPEEMEDFVPYMPAKGEQNASPEENMMAAWDKALVRMRERFAPRGPA